MILLTGTYTTSIPFEVSIFAPKMFDTRQDASNHIRDHFISVLREKAACTTLCLSDGWEVGVTIDGDVPYKVYAERMQGVISYHMKSETLHIVYRTDELDASNHHMTILSPRSTSDVIGPDTLYWNDTPSKEVTIALSMSLVSGYANSKIRTTMPKSYKDVSDIIPDADPVTTMIIVYAMLRTNDKYALFHVQDGSLYLYAEEGFIGLDEVVQGFEDGAICDPEELYAFSPMYRDVPSSTDATIEMYRGKFKVSDTKESTEEQFRDLLTNAFSPGLQWKERVTQMVTHLDIDQADAESVTYTLMRVVAKHKLLRGANVIFSQLPCSVPNARSP